MLVLTPWIDSIYPLNPNVNNNKFVSKYFEQDVIANLQYGYFSEVAK